MLPRAFARHKLSDNRLPLPKAVGNRNDGEMSKSEVARRWPDVRFAPESDQTLDRCDVGSEPNPGAEMRLVGHAGSFL
jgi:hypothetical protein